MARIRGAKNTTMIRRFLLAWGDISFLHVTAIARIWVASGIQARSACHTWCCADRNVGVTAFHKAKVRCGSKQGCISLLILNVVVPDRHCSSQRAADQGTSLDPRSATGN